MTPGPLVSTHWLSDHLADPRIKVLDATLRMPADPANAAEDFGSSHIPGAAFFDIDEIADRSSGLPHMVPPPEQFGRQVGALGIGNGDTVVIYDQQGLFSGPRAWWTFRLFGHDDVHVLDGGFPAWCREGRPTESGAHPVASATFEARFRPELLRDLRQVRAELEQQAQVLDARPAARFRGEAPEPRAGLRSGHMPNALNLPFPDLVEQGRLREPQVLRAKLESAGVDLDRPVTTTCGSGLTAAILALALARVGHWDAAIYDGSWTEWAGRADTPVVTGAA